MEPANMANLASDKSIIEEVEKVDDDAVKVHRDPFTAEEERRLVRKLDLWYVADIRAVMASLLLTHLQGWSL